MQLGVPLADRIEVRTVELRGGDLPALDEPEGYLRRQPQGVDDGGHPVGGTRNMSRSAAGALRSTSASGRDA